MDFSLIFYCTEKSRRCKPNVAFLHVLFTNLPSSGGNFWLTHPAKAHSPRSSQPLCEADDAPRLGKACAQMKHGACGVVQPTVACRFGNSLFPRPTPRRRAAAPSQRPGPGIPLAQTRLPDTPPGWCAFPPHSRAAGRTAQSPRPRRPPVQETPHLPAPADIPPAPVPAQPARPGHSSCARAAARPASCIPARMISMCFSSFVFSPSGVFP